MVSMVGSVDLESNAAASCERIPGVKFSTGNENTASVHNNNICHHIMPTTLVVIQVLRGFRYIHLTDSKATDDTESTY